MRYHSRSAGELSTLRLRAFMHRWQAFEKVHERHIKMVAQMRGAGLF